MVWFKDTRGKMLAFRRLIPRSSVAKLQRIETERFGKIRIWRVEGRDLVNRHYLTSLLVYNNTLVWEDILHSYSCY